MLVGKMMSFKSSTISTDQSQDPQEVALRAAVTIPPTLAMDIMTSPQTLNIQHPSTGY